MKKQTNLIMILVAAIGLAACTQSTPSMMNTARVELARETMVEQIPVEHLNDTTISVLANQYEKYGNGPIDLTMTFDPKSKNFTAMNAVHELKHVKSSLAQKGIRNISAQTLAVPEGKPSLMVAFDMVSARAPSDCTPMPGLGNNETDRFIGDYKFGCGVETALAKQIARPADLEGNSDMGANPARREAIVVEGYSAGVPRQPINGIERGDLSSN